MMKRSVITQALVLGLCCVPMAMPAQTAQNEPVTLTDKPTMVTLSNGIVSVTFWKKGAQFAPGTAPQPMPPPAVAPVAAPAPIAPMAGPGGNAPGGPPRARPMGPTGPRNGEGASILYTVNGKSTEFSDQRRAIYFDSGGDRIYPVSDGDMQIVSNTPEQAEIMWPGAPTDGVRVCDGISRHHASRYQRLLHVCGVQTSGQSAGGQCGRDALCAVWAERPDALRPPHCGRHPPGRSSAGSVRAPGAGHDVAVGGRDDLYQVQLFGVHGGPPCAWHGGSWNGRVDDYAEQ